MEATTFNFLNTIMTNNSPEQKVGIAESPKRQMPPWERASLIRLVAAELAMVQQQNLVIFEELWKTARQPNVDPWCPQWEKWGHKIDELEYKASQLQGRLYDLLGKPNSDLAIWLNIGRPVVICSVANEIQVRDLQRIDDYIAELDEQAAEDLTFNQ